MFSLGLGIKSYLYIGLAVAALALATKGFFWFTNLQEEMGNLREANAEYSIQVNALEMQKQSDAAVINVLQRASELQQEALVIVNGTFGEIRDERDQTMRILEGSRLGRLAAKRAQLIQERSNLATSEMFQEFEGVINEDL